MRCARTQSDVQPFSLEPQGGIVVFEQAGLGQGLGFGPVNCCWHAGGGRAAL